MPRRPSKSKATWKAHVKALVLSYCAQQGKRVFQLQDFTQFAAPELARAHPDNHHIQAKIRQQLQFLRDDKIVTFRDDKGTYILNRPQ